MPEEFLPLIKELIDESDEAFCLINNSKKIIHGNQKMSDLCRYSCSELIQLSSSQLFSPDLDITHSNTIVNTSILQTREGDVPVTIKVKILEKYDLVLLKILERPVLDYQWKYQKVSKELEQFAYIISHDLNAPLRAIVNLAEWIEDDLADSENEELKKFLALLKSRVSRMQGLITGVLDYSRAGRIKDAEEEVDVNLIIQEIQKNIDKPSFIISIEEPLPVITTVYKKLYLVLYHLISNAIKHHPDQSGCIRIGCKKLENGKFEFNVKDDGAGISPEHQEKIFVIFQTLESKDKVDTTGAGLAIVKKIIEDNDCEIKVESDKGQGADFIFTWK